MMSANPISSPCVNICQTDSVTGVCLGCGRTLQEITDWMNLNDEEKKRVIAQSQNRLNDLLFN
ncbi:MAG: DUF1289 domain-containing protein [Ferrovum sp. 37-45-19]|nr:hypothetical protein FERRO_09930 [Ferrovum sp. JA12]OYV78681.1 MAG: DUF1289 domain-containing protein [Ferrovum sp. 21-44-67]OYV93242.1 MAG: DUF1289 domain-containing protein [Ferrovum sp. 37-45-19]OZB33201.1 MAG: DUF1289 domain-containing protein [Ferrovum sp. 34-44-207]HQU07367.1 DUF1289 domain-containing protein [Ferrovaceae bacterium]